MSIQYLQKTKYNNSLKIKKRMKTKEACRSTDHLCDNCKNSYPICESRIRFGNGTGYDNIRGCTTFEEHIEGEIPFIEVEMNEDEFNSVYED